MPGGKKSAFIMAAIFAAILLSGADNSLLNKARAGDADSQFQLANEFFYGKNRNANLPLAYYWFRRAAVSGSAAARYNLAVCLQKGWGCKANPAGAFYNFKLAMDKGVKKAVIRYAEMLFVGVDAGTFEEEQLPEVKADPENAIAILRPVAQSDSEAMVLLAKLLYRDVEKNGKELRSVLEKYVSAAADPDPEMLLIYSACLRSGLGGSTPDPEAGAKILQRAVLKNHPEATAQLAEMMLMGWGMKPNKPKALKLYEHAMKLGSPRAKTDVAQMKLAGINMPHDLAGAFKLLTEAAEKKYPPALCKLGDCYAFGIGTEVDMSKALYNYLMAAELGDRLAAYRIGEYYRDGKYVPKNPAVSFHFFKSAAQAGHPGAMREVGKALLGGSGIDPDYTRAAEWLQRAAQAGDREAAEILRQ